MSKIRVTQNAQMLVSSTLGARNSRTVPRKPATSSVTKTFGSFLCQHRSAHRPIATVIAQATTSAARISHVCSHAGAKRIMATKTATPGNVPHVPGATGSIPRPKQVPTNQRKRSRRCFIGDLCGSAAGSALPGWCRLFPQPTLSPQTGPSRHCGLASQWRSCANPGQGSHSIAVCTLHVDGRSISAHPTLHPSGTTAERPSISSPTPCTDNLANLPTSEDLGKVPLVEVHMCAGSQRRARRPKNPFWLSGCLRSSRLWP